MMKLLPTKLFQIELRQIIGFINSTHDTNCNALTLTDRNIQGRKMAVAIFRALP